MSKQINKTLIGAENGGLLPNYAQRNFPVLLCPQQIPPKLVCVESGPPGLNIFYQQFVLLKPCYGSDGQQQSCHRRGKGSIPGQSVSDLQWTKWHWDKFFSKYVCFLLSVSFHGHFHLNITLIRRTSRRRCGNFQRKRCWGLRSSGVVRSVCWGVLTDVSEQPMGPILKYQAVQEKWTAWPLKMGPVICPETSVNNYQHMLHNVPPNEILSFTTVETRNFAKQCCLLYRGTMNRKVLLLLLFVRDR